MKRVLIGIMLLAAAFTAVPAMAGAQKKADKATSQWRYDIEPAGNNARQGTAMVKVWSYSKKDKIAINQAAKNAVHGVLFKGYGSVKPMVDAATAEKNKAFFDSFFQEGGGFRQYVQFTNNGAVKPADRIKIGKEWKIGLIVVVSKDQLRKDLEAKGVLNKLGYMF